ncbi:RNA-binding (RRM/RBD/RNP motifs) family protein [Tasmannia lanceolata]|uniref:RNA-binding (RRM/RBD/RNP motifs) family protein n=1 Tax=Tasmannia lanceolata TaxID=3420 RepID=UPI004062F676
MLATFLPLCNSSSTLIPFSPPLFSNKTHKKKPHCLYWNASSTNNFFFSGRTGFSVSASSNGKRSKNLVEILDEDEFEDDDDDGEEEKEMISMPLEEMGRWFRNKPSGFGEGKAYDISIEEKLLEEIEQSRKAQITNINELKTSPPNPNSKKQEQPQKALEVFPGRNQVRIGNLPKKKNIHRDLQLAFKGFPGIVNISPVVSGNKKTRDPICKGFAFVYLESEKAAYRFIEVYSKQNLKFGKLQKQITCEITNPQCSSNSASEKLAEITSISTPQLRFPAMGAETEADSDMNDNLGDLQEGTFSEGSTGIPLNGGIELTMEHTDSMDNQDVFPDSDEIEVGIEHIHISTPNNKQGVITAESLSSKQRQKRRTGQKRQTDKKNSEKTLRLNVPGSANRLKIKERAVLNGVFLKYGGKAELASSRES